MVHRKLGQGEIGAMELYELALQAEGEDQQRAMICGATVPMAVRRLALEFLDLDKNSGKAAWEDL